MPSKALWMAGFMAVTFPALAQELKDSSSWTQSYQFGLNVNQASFSSNWKAGGTNSLSIGSVFNAKVEYNSRQLNFVNDLQLQYGRLYNQTEPVGFPSYRKTADRIFFDSKLGYKFAPKWQFFGSLNLQSQFDVGYKYDKTAAGKDTVYRISNFFAPGFITESFGIEYKPVSYFWARAGVGTMRQTIVNDNNVFVGAEKTAYGVKRGESLRNEIAFMLVADLDKDLMKNLNLKLRYQGFASYEDVQAIDSRVDLILTARVNKWVNVNITSVMLYDQDQDLDVQYSQSLALGFLYTF